MSSSRKSLAAYRLEAEKAMEISQKLLESTSAYEKVVQKSKKTARQFHSAANGALAAAEDLHKAVGVEKEIGEKFARVAEEMDEDVKLTMKAADHYLQSATHLRLEVIQSNREIDKEVAKLPPNSLVTTRSNRTATDCTTEESDSRTRGRRYQ